MRYALDTVRLPCKHGWMAPLSLVEPLGLIKSTCSSFRIEAYHSDLVITVCNLNCVFVVLGLVLSKPIDRGITVR
jgi:hypothetical protein